MCSPLKGSLLFVSLKATRDQQNFQFWLSAVWLRVAGGMHTGELDSTVWCKLWNQTTQKCLSTLFYKKTSYHWVTYYIIFIVICILRHHREITIVKLRIKTDSAVWCTPRSFFFNSNILAKSKPNSKISWTSTPAVGDLFQYIRPALALTVNYFFKF